MQGPCRLSPCLHSSIEACWAVEDALSGNPCLRNAMKFPVAISHSRTAETVSGSHRSEAPKNERSESVETQSARTGLATLCWTAEIACQAVAARFRGQGRSSRPQTMSKQADVKAYPQEFREKVVHLMQTGERSPQQVAEKFGISEDSVRRWVQQAERDQGRRRDGAQDPDESRSLIRSGATSIPKGCSAFVGARQGQYPIACLRQVLGVSASRYYAWRKRPPDHRYRSAARSRPKLSKSLRWPPPAQKA